MKLNLFMPTTKHSIKEQYVIYDANSFVADVGGYLGLLLGHSLLGIGIDAINWMLRAACESRKRKTDSS